jgi:hypothetical protein
MYMERALHRAAVTNAMKKVTEIVERFGIHVDSKQCDVNGRTPLSLAAISNAYDVVAYLVEQDASLEHADNNGHTPLHLACLYSGDDIRTIKILVTSGANVAAVDNDGNTALMLASRDQCSPYAVTWLLAHGGARITDEGYSIWTGAGATLKAIARCPLTIDIIVPPTNVATTFTIVIKRSITITSESLCEMLSALVLHERPPESLVEELDPVLQRIVKDAM